MADKTPEQASRRWRVFGVRAFVTIAFLAPILIWFHPEELLEAVKRTGIVLWAFTVITATLVHVVLAAKWRILLRAAGNRAGFVDTLKAHGAGLFANIWLPSLIGGDVIRTGMVTGDRKNLPAAITGVVADRLSDVASLLILMALGLMLMPAQQTTVEVGILAIAGAALLLGVFTAAVALKRMNPHKFPQRFARALTGMREALEAMLERKSATALALITAVATQGLFIFQNILIAEAIGIHVPVAAWLLAFPLAKLVAFLPVSLGGLGVREGVVVVVLIPFSVPPPLSIAQSLVWQTVTYTTGLFGGIASLCIGYLKSRSKRESECVLSET